MSKTKTQNWFSKILNKSILPALALIALTGGMIGGYNYLNNFTNYGNNALAALNCPAGSSLSGSQCISTTPSSYTCPAGQTLNGSNCVITSLTCPSGTVLSGNNCVPEVCFGPAALNCASPPIQPTPTQTTSGPATPVYGTSVTPTSYTPDVGQITGITCNNTSPVVGSSINCTVTGSGAPSGVPYGGSVTLSVDNGGGTSTCTFTGSATATCGPVTVGSAPGAKTVTTTSGGTLSINVIKVNFGKVDWVFSPDQGGISPLFRSQDSTSIRANNFRTSTDLTPTSNIRYTCTFEYRALNDRLTTATGTGLTWTSLNTTPIPYTTGTGTNVGCTVNLTKTQRANALNHSLRLTITDTTITNPSTTNPNTYLFYNEYIFRFQGAGVASGGGTTTTLTASAIQANYYRDIPAITIAGAAIPNQIATTITIPGCVAPINGFVNNNIFTAPSTPGTQMAGIDRSIQNCANLGASQATLNITGFSPIPVSLTMLAAGRVKPVSMTYTNDLNNQASFASGTGIKIVKQGTTTPLGTTTNVNTIMQGDKVTITVTGLVDFETNQPVNSGTCYIDLATTPSGQISQSLISLNSAIPVDPNVNISNGTCTITGKVMQQGQYQVRVITKGPKGGLTNMGDPFNTLILLI